MPQAGVVRICCSASAHPVRAVHHDGGKTQSGHRARHLQQALAGVQCVHLAVLHLPLIALGADGLVSVCANEIPKETSRMVEHALNGSFHFARKINYKILPLLEANFVESSPAPCKFLMKEMGLCEENLRLPLVPVTKPTQDKLRTIAKTLGLTPK